MADEEIEAGEGGKKSSILTYILIGVGVVVTLAITVLATMYFVGFFDPKIRLISSHYYLYHIIFIIIFILYFEP